MPRRRSRSPIRRRRLSGGRALLKKGKCPTGIKDGNKKDKDGNQKYLPLPKGKKYVRRTVCASKIADATTLHGRYRQVYEGRADRTKSGLKKSDLRENRRGVIVSKKKQSLGKDADQSESFQANKIRRQTVSKAQFEALARLKTKNGDIRYKYWKDDDGDKFRIVKQRNPLRIQFKNKKTGEYEEEVLDWDEGDAAYTDNQTFTAPIMGMDYDGLSGGRRIRGGKYRTLAEAAGPCSEIKTKRGYPTRPTTMCVLVNKRRKRRKRPCLKGKVRRSGGRCAPGATTPCKQEGQVRRKNSNTGKYECRKKSSRNKTIKQRREECKAKGKVFAKNSKGKYVCRNKKKPKKKSKKSSNKKKKPKKTVAQKIKDCKAKGLVYNRKTKRCRKKKSNKKKKKSKK